MTFPYSSTSRPSGLRARRLHATPRFGEVVHAVLACVVTWGCSAHDDVRPNSLESGAGGALVGFESDSCEPGEHRICTVTLEQSNGRVSCFFGLQQCEDSTWSACSDRALSPETDASVGEEIDENDPL